MDDAICILKCNSEVLQTDGVVEELVKCGILDLLLIFHFDFQDFPLVHVRVANHILGQIDALDRLVDFENLGQNEQIFTVEALLAKVQLNKPVKLDFAHRDLATVHTNSL